MNGIVFSQVCKKYPNASTYAVDHVDLTINQGEFVVFLGPSGCGKTTLLKMVNRLSPSTSGTTKIDGVDITTIPATQLRRQIGYVIQQNGLFPHMRVEDNIAVVPRLLGWKEDVISTRVDELLEMVHLEPAVYRKRYPFQLSGGQQQRVGIARAMAANPSILLMDEPFGALDAITRLSLQDELLRIQKQLKKTILFVTHDLNEAIRLADRIVILNGGKVVQFDTPYNIITHPANDFVKQLLGDRDVFRRMSVVRMKEILPDSLREQPTDSGLFVSEQESVKDAFEKLVESGQRMVHVTGEDNRVLGTFTLSEIVKFLENRRDHGR